MVGYFGDDRFQGHGHERKYMISIGDDGSGVVSNASYGSNFIVSNAIGLPAKNERTSAYGDPRYGMTTRTKQKGVIFIIKIL